MAKKQDKSAKPAADDPVFKVLEALKKRAGERATVRMLGNGPLLSDIDDVIPSGIDVLDHHVLAVGGWPVGRIVEVYADNSVGKSSLLYQSLAGTQRAGGAAALYETEQAIEGARPEVFGVDVGSLIFDQPGTMEDALSMIEDTLDSLPKSKKGDPAHMVAWDSLAASPTRAEIKEGLTGKLAVGDRARIMSHAMRVLTRKVSEKRAVLFVVNQSRQSIGSWGGMSTTPGGNALKFHASIRLELFGGAAVKDASDRHVGKQVTAMATKTKVGGAPFAKAKVRLFFDSGWNNTWSTVWHAKDRGLVAKAAPYDASTYAEALAALKWSAGFASGAEPEGDACDAEDEA